MIRFHNISSLLRGLLLTVALLPWNVVGRTPVAAEVLAKNTGAAQFEEKYEVVPISQIASRRLHKRSSDEDVDYEVYQGVVGRPGIDFPIFPKIPQTSFSCRNFGSGYFADLETDCQVFHICEEGRKISFLCPNGTIFQQSELTCDWWFKVNCAGSPIHYLESAELLSKTWKKAKSAKKVKIEEKPLKYKNSGRRFDSIEVNRYENTDFEDVSDEKYKTSQSIEEKSIEVTRPKSSKQPTQSSLSSPAKRRNGYNYAGQIKTPPPQEEETTIKARTSRRKPITTTTSSPQVSSEDLEVNPVSKIVVKPEKIQLPPLRSINKFDNRKTSTFYYTPTVPTVPKTSTTEATKRQHVLTTSKPTTFVPTVKFYEIDNQKTEKQKRNKGKKLEKTVVSSESADTSTPALGQDALASLATYFADTENKTLESQPRNATSTLTVKTTKKYAELFGFSKDEENKSNFKESNITFISPTQSMRKTSNETANIITNIVKKPESRKIAEVFSNALTTYLKDPTEFRRTLSNVRPTEPSLSLVTTTISNSAEIATEFDSFEINKNRVKYSTVNPLKLKQELDDSEEILQRAHSQSFLNNKNNIKSSNKKIEPHFVPKSTATSTKLTTSTTTPKSTTTKSTKTTTTFSTTTTENFKLDTIEKMVYLDPITINDQLMNEIKTTTTSSFTYLPMKGSKKSHHLDSGEFLNTPFITPTASLIPFASSEESSSIESSQHNARYLTAELPSSSGMQKIANKIFGGLNDTEAGHLMNVMKKAKNNKSALHLILLLIQTCDDENGRTIEKSRKAILKSLIQLDHRNDFEIATTPHPFAITTFRRDYSPVRTTLASLIESTTTATPSESTKFEIRVDDTTTTENLQSDATTNLIRKTKDVEGQSGEASSTNDHKSSDKRALELLKSLYFLASKYDSRR
ncbi:hypothetical protein ACFFRR_007342 [Megaselia abdita]